MACIRHKRKQNKRHNRHQSHPAFFPLPIISSHFASPSRRRPSPPDQDLLHLRLSLMSHLAPPLLPRLLRCVCRHAPFLRRRRCRHYRHALIRRRHSIAPCYDAERPSLPSSRHSHLRRARPSMLLARADPPSPQALFRRRCSHNFATAVRPVQPPPRRPLHRLPARAA